MPELLTLLPEDPETVGPYRLQGRLGTGGQGTVYAGRAPDGVLVAVKLLHPHLVADEEARVRFLREVRTAKRVAPFCTAQMLDSGFVGARPYIVSEYVDGPSLQQSVRESGARGPAALHRLAINTATALAAIHAAGVVHRDFKPGNVLLGPDGPVVIDFGIAKALDLSQSLVSSQPIGSPAYMAPEQIADGEVGPPADLFAWAATMYYAATGRRAFPGETIPATLHAVLRGEPDLSRFEERFRGLLRECLSKDPAPRPTAAQVVERLRALPTPAWHDTPPLPTPGWHDTPPLPTPGWHDTPPLPTPDGHGYPPCPVPPLSVPGGQDSLPTPVSVRQDTTAGHDPGRRERGGRRAIIAVSSAAALAVTAGLVLYALSPATAQRQAAAPTPAASVPPLASPPAGTPEPSPTELPATMTPGEANDLAPPTRTGTGTRAPRRSATPASASASAPARDAAAKDSTAPHSPRSTPKPTRRPASPSSSARSSPSRTPAAKKTSSRPAPEPSTGTVSWTDASAYCKAQGDTNSFAAGWDNMRCLGSGTTITPSMLCQWKYPSYSQAVAEPPAHSWMPSTNCNLS
ncbi:serine/threonine protein kinase [Nonomuraea candida]|uniref:serine/threonine protein kinase n=1 Tax=Nonomuraea candida TaxID=359159 RepID=UPI00069449A3|nr:serine/threonine-protein kinase [Nonomuraea candida]